MEMALIRVLNCRGLCQGAADGRLNGGRAPGENSMAVTGVGGFFFRAHDPAALSAWYKQHLGIGGEHGLWQQEGGPTVFAPFDWSTSYFAADKQFMLNLRVSDLDGLLDQLRSSGIEVLTSPDWNSPETGRFARIHDPEGNALELWEPPS
jgi:predicted enzyme related to lactoylglutathione lyase